MSSSRSSNVEPASGRPRKAKAAKAKPSGNRFVEAILSAVEAPKSGGIFEIRGPKGSGVLIVGRKTATGEYAIRGATKYLVMEPKKGSGNYVIKAYKPRGSKHEVPLEEQSLTEQSSLARVSRISALAGTVFGDRDKAERWLSKPKRALGGKTPLSCLTDSSGEKIVESMLYQIDSGDVA